jgi:Cu-Zn family superoxide dismutase
LVLGGNVKRITKAALGGVASCALVLGGTQAAVGELSEDATYVFAGPLRDLQPGTDGPFDSAKAILKVWETSEGTTYSIRIKGIDSDAEGQLFGAHLHTGPCIEGAGGAAGPHYNHGGAVTLEENEVWFELVPDENGIAVDETSVLFVPEDVHGDQIMSIVIHEKPTDELTGIAGLREACLPLDFSDDDQ